MLSDLARTHGRVRRIGRFPESLKLDLPRGDHPLPDRFGGLTDIRVGRQFAETDQRHLAVDVDPVWQCWSIHCVLNAVKQRIHSPNISRLIVTMA